MLTKLIDLIAGQNPLQGKRINTFVNQQDTAYRDFAEELLSFFQSEQDLSEAARAYNQVCMELLREQIRFRKTGVYELKDATKDTRYYIIGLLLSYLFWPNHYRMFCFFKEHLDSINIERCLEVGVGHGLFTTKAIQHFPDLSVTLIDNSEASIQVAKEMLDFPQAQFIHSDYLVAPLEDSFDFIIMGEVIEHVNNVAGFLERTHQLLQLDGTVFLSTCANCPAIDHVYHFHTIGEIRDLIQEADLSIARELVLPAENIPEDKWQEELVTINYCAILERR